MNFENTKKKIEKENLPVWKLFRINARGVPSLISKFNEEDVKRSVKYLDEQVKFFSNERDEVCFEIRAKNKLTSNGEHSELSWEFCVPPAKKQEEPNARLNGNYTSGLGIIEHPYVQRELSDLRTEKREIEEKKDALREEKLQLVIAQNNLQRDKELWAKEQEMERRTFDDKKKQFDKEFDEMKKKFDDNVEAGKEALSKFWHGVLRPAISDLSPPAKEEALAGAEPKSDKERMVESIATNIFESELTLEEIKAIGIHVQRLKKQFESAKNTRHETTEA